MNTFLIITNEQKDRNLSVTHSIQDYIAAKGGRSFVWAGIESKWNLLEMESVQKEKEAQGCIVLGGDGTLVRAARDMAEIGIPLIGVNLGTLGYLCEVDKTSIFEAVDCLFEDRYEVEERMMLVGCALEGRGFRQNAAGDGTTALNDIVIHRLGSAQMINLVLSVDGEYLTTYCADGVIISTPTGSTGYSMSAGGPIVDPNAKLILITPINPHTFSTRSIVVGADARIEVMLTRRRAEGDEEAEVSFDGDRCVQMKVGSRFGVRQAGVSARVMKLNQLSFLQILRKKMQEYR